MAAWTKIYAKGWPKRTQITVLLREESEDGAPLSGEVTIVIRKGNIQPTEQKLGLSKTHLRVAVTDGVWEGPVWDYQYWADKRFDTLVAKFPGAEDATWSPRRIIEQRRDIALVPTSISAINFSRKVDDTAPEKMIYVLSWTILDQFKHPIAGKVTTLFDGESAILESKEDRVGVCLESVFVKGFGRQMFYQVMLPTGEVKTITLHGPDKQPDKPLATMVKLSDLSFTSKPHATDIGKLLYTVYWTVAGSDGQAFKKPTVSRLFGGGMKSIVGDDNGLCFEDNIGVSEKEPYTVFIPGATGADARKEVELKGPAKKEQEIPKIYAIEADLDSAHPVGGKFIVAGAFRIDDKSADFTAVVSSSPENVVVESRLGKVEPGDDPDTYKLTSRSGKFKLAVPATFTEEYIELEFTAPDGTSVSVPMVKPN